MWTTRRTALALFLIVSFVYQFPLLYDLAYKPFFNWAPGQDIASTSLLPISALVRGDFTLNEYQEFFRQNYDNSYFVAEVNGKIVSRSPVAAAVLAIPFYGFPLGSGWLVNSGRAWLAFPWTGFMVAKFAAAFMTALAVLMFFFCLRTLADAATSLAITLVFAFGTSVWSTASQSLWQQTPSLLFQVLGLWFVLRGRRQGALAVAPGAFFFSAATVARPNNALVALLFTLYVAMTYRPALVRWILWAILPALFFFGYNAIYNGSPLVFGIQDGVLQYLHVPQIEGVIGQFTSPSRGLLVYSPFYLFAFYGAWLGLRGPDRLLYLVALVVIAFNVLLFSMMLWDGGWGYGTRLLTDVLPYATLFLVPAFLAIGKPERLAFWSLGAYAVVVNSFALWDYGVRWHWHWDHYAYNVWDLAESEPLFYLKQYAAMFTHYLGAYVLK